MRTTFKLSVLVAGLLGMTAVAAHADCEADLVQLESTMKAPGQTAEHLALLKTAGDKAAEALRKDDDKTCHQIVLDALNAAGSPATPAQATIPATSQVSIGDLQPMRVIADDTLKIVQKGDLAGAKARVKDLESLWDRSRSEMRARNTAAWETLDKLIDTALKQLRADKPDAKGSADALGALLAAIDKTK